MHPADAADYYGPPISHMGKVIEDGQPDPGCGCGNGAPIVPPKPAPMLGAMPASQILVFAGLAFVIWHLLKTDTAAGADEA